jgi:predicted nucleic acid-binding protein
MTAKCFADTNVAIYALDADAAKRTKALAILDSRPFISTQVVNEYLNVLLVKRRLDRVAAHELARALMTACEVVSVSPAITDLAMSVGERYQLSHWDSLIVAAALAADCDALYSEDMQDGQVFEGKLTVKNPFAGA